MRASAQVGGDMEGCGTCHHPHQYSGESPTSWSFCCWSGLGVGHVRAEMEHDSHSTWEFSGSFYQPSAFLLKGIPGLAALHHWVSIPFCALYLIALSGNCMILFLIRKTPSLHERVCCFLSMLAVTDLAWFCALCPPPWAPAGLICEGSGLTLA